MPIIQRIRDIEHSIHQAESLYHRAHGSVKLLAITKGRSATEIECAFAAGLRDFGESYIQEAQLKISALHALPVIWHFIGPIQSNKTKSIAQHFSWVHSVSRLKIAQRLNHARPDALAPLQVCIQVNFGDDVNKSGVHPDEVIQLAEDLMQLPRLQLRGLMLIPKQQSDHDAQYRSFLRLTTLLNTLNQTLHLSLDTLSMGMSEDYLAAIQAGSTMIRLGRCIFNRENP